MTPTLNDQLIALGAHVEVFGLCCRETGEAIVSFGRTARRAIASSILALSRERRAEYWTLRKEGMYPLDALARMRVGEGSQRNKSQTVV